MLNSNLLNQIYRSSHKLFQKTIFLSCILICVSTNSAPLSKQQWLEDLDFYASNLKSHHINLFHTLSANEFSRLINDLKSQVEDKTDNEIIVDLMRLTRKIDDGHTSLPLWGADERLFPLKLKIIEDQIFVVQTTDRYSELLGAKLTSINGVSSSEILALFADIVPFTENEYSKKHRTAQYISSANVLDGLGIIDDIKKANFEFEINDKILTYELNTKKSYSFDKKISFRDHSKLKIVEKIDENVWFASSENKETVYFLFRRYPSMSEMESIAEDLLTFINKYNSKHLVIDLRENYGGDFFIGLKLAQSLVLADSIDWKSGVYTLIDNGTFSAAMSNASQFSRLLNSRLVGEPTGAKPSGYQDMGTFELPNSGLVVSYSKRIYHFKDDSSEALFPDVHLALTINDYLNKNDPQLNWVLDDIKKKSEKRSSEH